MLMPKSNGVASPAAASCGKNAVAAVYPYSCAPIPEAFQQMTMPMNGHYPVTSKFFNLQCDSKMLRFYPPRFSGNISPTTEWWGAGVVVCLVQGADLHSAQLMPLPLTVSCFSKIHIGFTFLVPAHPGSPRKRAVKRVCVCFPND